MIGVAVHANEEGSVTEFFELFKTPWEFYRHDARYDVLICTRGEVPPNTAKLVLRYGAGLDEAAGLPMKLPSGGTIVRYGSRRIPVYSGVTTFPAGGFSPVTVEETGAPVTCASTSGDGTVLRVGYNLFREVRHLLATGQPAVNAASAALELHIALLRDLITRSGIPVVEIPPVPAGHSFIVCLTHDLDHPVLRNHCCDRTMLGFLYRAVWGTVVHVCRGRKSLRALGANWLAALKLPFVYLGMAKDLWRGFDRYLEIEAGLASTYFVIPTRNYPGQPFAGNGISRRAVRYDVTDVQTQLRRVISAGCEVGLHGIDTWVDSRKGIEERERVTRTLGTSVNGVRMHWLFFDEKSPAVLERAGFAYDSTIGYRETVGYRAGTLQAYKPLATANLLELPLHVMDTALFFPKYLNLSETEAERVVCRLIDDAAEFGGALTINWHDRSIAPERLWDGFYLKLLRELKGRGAWFATADQAVSWFKKRRSAVVKTSGAENGKVRVQASVGGGDKLPALRVRVHKPGPGRSAGAAPAKSSPAFADVVLQDKVDTEVGL